MDNAARDLIEIWRSRAASTYLDGHAKLATISRQAILDQDFVEGMALRSYMIRHQFVDVRTQTIRLKFQTCTIVRLFGGKAVKHRVLCGLAIDELTKATVKRMTSIESLAKWLKEEGFEHDRGSRGLYSRSVID